MNVLWSRVNTIMLALVLLALLSMIAMLASGVRGGPLDPPAPPGSTDSVRQPGTPISSLPFTITSPGNYYLTRSLTHNGAGSAISISASNVTLDLGGFSLQGSDTAGSRGIFVTGLFFPMTIQHGTVRDFEIGVDGVGGSMVKVKDVTAYSNSVGILVGNHTEISDCTIGVSSQQGIRVVGSLGRIQNCLVFDSGLAGIRIEGMNNVVESNRMIRNNTTGVFSIDISIGDASSVENAIRDNTIAGFIQTDTTNLLVRDNAYCGFISGSSAFWDVNNTSFCG